jgi:two-component system OmpR family sensor kinase/two-component system sensor histidine kinase BaeS
MKQNRTGQSAALDARSAILSSLWLQLALGFALVTLVTTLTVALVANMTADATFRGYVAQSQLAEGGLADRLAGYYAAHGSWEGVGALLEASPGPGMGMGMGHGQGAMMGGLVLADAQGRVVADPAGLAGESLSRAERASALPIVVEGRSVGYLLAHTTRGAALPAAGERFLAALNRTLWVTGALAAALGLGLGLLIARRLAAPLGALDAGARRIAAGRLDERVPVAGPAEVRSVASAFNEMAAGLEAGEAQRRQMVADIAHELRTPLTVIQGNLRAMLDDVYPLSKDEVATIYEASQGLRRLVDDLRELSLAEAGRLELRPQAVAVAPLLAREVALFAEVAEGVTLRAEGPPELPEVMADPERLAQVLHNLVSNALRHTPAGGCVTLRAAPVAPGPDGGSTASRPAAVRFEVVDSGAGIAAADLPHVFERFYRADRGRARHVGGSGLGLAITRQLVLLQGGQIGVESVLGQGARFWFTLPAA